MRKKHIRKQKIKPQDIKNYGLVLLTQEQFDRLIENFGEDLTMFAVKLLNDKIKVDRSDGKLRKAKNHYQYFRSDSKIILFALEVMNSSQKYGHIYFC